MEEYAMLCRSEFGRNVLKMAKQRSPQLKICDGFMEKVWLDHSSTYYECNLRRDIGEATKWLQNHLPETTAIRITLTNDLQCNKATKLQRFSCDFQVDFIWFSWLIFMDSRFYQVDPSYKCLSQSGFGSGGRSWQAVSTEVERILPRIVVPTKKRRLQRAHRSQAFQGAFFLIHLWDRTWSHGAMMNVTLW